MNFDRFQKLYQIAQYEEIKVIGKDIDIDGKPLHIIAMAKQHQGQMYLYVLEAAAPITELGRDYQKKTNRESMVSSTNRESFLNIAKIKVGSCEIEMQGAHSGVMMQGDYEDIFLFLVKMSEQGWKVPERSYFYKMDWKQIALTVHNVVTKGKVQQLSEMKSKGLTVPNIIAPPENLPDFDKETEMEITLAKTCKSQLLQIPVKLEIGAVGQITFTDDNGEQAICYISEVKLEDVLKEAEEHFTDSVYREKMLQYCTEHEFEEHRNSILKTVQEDCPEGMCYISITYECTSEVSLQFYAKEYLDTVPEPKNHCSSLVFLRHSEQGEGPHGLKNRFCMIQHAVPRNTRYIDAELFMAIRAIPEKTINLLQT